MEVAPPAPRFGAPAADADPLAQVLELVAGAATPRDRQAALALAEAAIEGDVARFVAHRAHLVIRGGAPTLLREALSQPSGSPVRGLAEAAAARDALGVRLVRRGGTRRDDDGRVRTIETGARSVAQAALSADGAFVYAFVTGRWLDDDGLAGDRVMQWRTATGELVREGEVGQVRDGSGSLAVSPDGRTLAVRKHRSIAIHDLDAWTPELSAPPLRHVLDGSEGPYAMTFLDDVRLVADDASLELVLWDTTTGQRLAASPSIGWRAHAVARGAARVVVGGGGTAAKGRTVGAHALPSLALAGCVGDRAGMYVRTMAVDVSPSERLLATGDHGHGVHLWAMADLIDPERHGTAAAPVRVAPRHIGDHADRVSAVRFVGETHLLSGAWDGAVACWALDDPAAPPRELVVHRDVVASLAVHPRLHLAVSAAEADGRIIVWDLTGRGTAPRPPLPRTQKRRELRSHPAGVAVITDGCTVVVARERGPSPAGPSVAQPPALRGARIGGLDVTVVDGPGLPRLHVWRGDQLVDVVELEAHAAGVCALDARSLAVADVDGHVAFWELY